MRKIHKSVLLVYYYIYITILFFATPYMNDQNIQITDFAKIQSLSILILVILLFIGGYLADKKFKIKNLTTAFLTLSTVSLGVMLNSDSQVLLLISYTFMFVSFMIIPSFLDGLILKDLEKKDVSITRAYGSFGAAIGFFLNSYIIADLSSSYLLYIAFFLMLILNLLIYFLKERKMSISDKSNYSSLLKNKKVLLIILITFFSYGVLSADDAFQFSYAVEVVKMSEQLYGINSFIAIIIELLIMISFYKLLKKFDLYYLLLTSVSSLLLMFIMKIFFVESIILISISNIIMGIFTGLYIPLILHIVSKVIDKNLKNSMLSLYLISLKLSGALLGYITSLYVELNNSIASIYQLHAVCVCFSIVLIVLNKKSIK